MLAYVVRYERPGAAQISFLAALLHSHARKKEDFNLSILNVSVFVSILGVHNIIQTTLKTIAVILLSVSASLK